MKKTYLLIHGRNLGTRDEVKACLEAIPEIIEWRTEIINSFFIISESSAQELVPLIRKCRGDKGTFFITEVTTNRQRWMTPDSWVFIGSKNPKFTQK